MIENSVNTQMFNSIIIKDCNEGIIDLLNNGEYSCASFVSSVLLLNNIVSKTCATVLSLERSLKDNPNIGSIYDESKIIPGDILVWEKTMYEDGSGNRHIGFAISNKEAISTSYKNKCVIKHLINKAIENTGEPRKIERIFRIIF